MLRTPHGDTWDLVVTYCEPTEGSDPDDPPEPDLENVVDITGYTGLLQIRDRPGGPVALELTTEDDGGLFIDGTEGTVTIHATPDQMYGVVPGSWQVELQIEYAPGDTVLDRRTILRDTLIVESQIAVATP